MDEFDFDEIPRVGMEAQIDALLNSLMSRSAAQQTITPTVQQPTMAPPSAAADRIASSEYSYTLRVCNKCPHFGACLALDKDERLKPICCFCTYDQNIGECHVIPLDCFACEPCLGVAAVKLVSDEQRQVAVMHTKPLPVAYPRCGHLSKCEGFLNTLNVREPFIGLYENKCCFCAWQHGWDVESLRMHGCKLCDSKQRKVANMQRKVLLNITRSEVNVIKEVFAFLDISARIFFFACI